MKQANRHFPIHAVISSDAKVVEIKNFLGILFIASQFTYMLLKIGEKIVRKINLLPGVTAYKKEETKDEITLIGTDINNVSLSCNYYHTFLIFIQTIGALINQCMTVGRKDMRKFLDGIYISERRLEMKE